MKRAAPLLILASVVVLAVTAALYLGSYSEVPGFRVAIVSVVEIDPIAELREGFRETFDASAFAKKRNVIYEEHNAQGDPGLINQIADKIAARPPDLVFVLGTPMAQAIQNRSPKILLVQGACTDPVAAGLADSWQGSGRNYAATSNLPPVEKQVKLLRELTPAVRRIGTIYNPGEANSVAVIRRLRRELDKQDVEITLVERPVSNTADVATAASSLVGNVDAIYLVPDNTAHAAIRVIGQVAIDHSLPFYATVENALEHGALAALALDYHTLGNESAELALGILDGLEPATTPIRLNRNPKTIISRGAAVRLGISLEGFSERPDVTITD